MQVAENARCEKPDLAAGVGQVWIYVRVGGAKNHTGLQGWPPQAPPHKKKRRRL